MSKRPRRQASNEKIDNKLDATIHIKTGIDLKRLLCHKINDDIGKSFYHFFAECVFVFVHL